MGAYVGATEGERDGYQALRVEPPNVSMAG